MTKVVINTCFGGFGLSHDAIMKWSEYSGTKIYFQVLGSSVPSTHYFTNPNMNTDSYWSEYNLKRDDPALVRVVEEMGRDSFGKYSELRVVEIPDGIDWYIHDYDGSESIHEAHRSWS